MTHLRIEQNTTGIEEVSINTLKKLYEIASSGTLDVSSNIKGRLNAAAAYPEWISYLTSHYPELYITATKTYVAFNDPAFEKACATLYGDGIGMTMQDFQAVTDNSPLYAFNGNTEITDMTELKYFTNIPGDPNNNDQSGTTEKNHFWLYNITNLTTVVLPDQIQYAARHRGLEDGVNDFKGIFYQCPNLQQVHYPDNLIRLTAGSNPPIVDIRNTKLTRNFSGSAERIEEAYLPSTVTGLGTRSFFDSHVLRKLVVEQGQSPLVIEDDMGYDSIFYNAPAGWILDLPSNTTQIHTSMFDHCKNGTFILRATTPPTGIKEGGSASTDRLAYASVIDLYVPDDSISLYQSNSIYSDCKSIKGISELPTS